jgi:subtilase family serine protease
MRQTPANPHDVKNKSAYKRIVPFMWRKKRYLLLGFVFFTVLAYLSSQPSIVNAKNRSPVAQLGGPSIRPITYRPYKYICSAPRANHARCLAQESLAANGQPLTGSPALSGYGPTQFHTAYNLPCTPGGAVASVCSAPSTFGPETIAIVDAGNFSTGTSGLQTSLSNYDTNYDLPACTLSNGCLDVVNQSGSTSSLPSDQGWSDEIALDVEVAHMVCQTCKIVLVEANSDLTSDLATSNVTAATFNPISISNSWGSSVDQSFLDSDFTPTGIADVVATGDNGSVSNGASWPADVPDVTAVAGTTLQINSDNTWNSESVWDDSGGGCSDYYNAPLWQTSLSNWNTAGCGSYRSFGDVSADADPSTGAAININSTWYQYGGTSLATPIIASIYALADGIPSGTTAVSIPYSSYSGANFHDVTSGSDCDGSNVTHCTAGVGFDTPSGLGTPDGINGFSLLPTQPTDLVATTVDQNHINLSWTGSSGGDGIAGYHVYRNGIEVGTVANTTFSDSGLTPNTTYSYYVVAYDNNDDLSPASSSVSSFSAYPSDINEDGHINLLDLSILASKYGESGPGLGRADINGDGVVNLLDLSILASNYGSE